MKQINTIKELENYAGSHDWVIVQIHDNGYYRYYMTPCGNFIGVGWDKNGNINGQITPILWNITQ